MIRRFTISLMVLMLGGCGPAIYHSEQYDVVPYEAYKDGEVSVYLAIAPEITVQTFGPLYYSEKRTEPYTVEIIVRSRTPWDGEIEIHSVQLEIENEGRFELLESPKSKTFVETDWIKFYEGYATAKLEIPLGNKLQFAEGAEVSVQAEFSLSNSDDRHKLVATFIAVLIHEVGTTLDIAMGV